MKTRFHPLIFVAIVIVTLLFVFGFLFKRVKGEKWGFVGYQYKWSENYVERSGFNSENECVKFGNQWLEKQSSKEAIFTCSLNLRPSDIPGIDTADKICEYGIRGFIQCRE